MKGFQKVDEIIFPVTKAKEAYSFMRKAGEEGVEGVALFAGKLEERSFEITNTIIPKQRALAIESGLLYSVDGDELHRINVWLHENKLQLIAQIHSHPNRAYHSTTDDAFPIIATLGGISIVVPDFAKRPMNIKDWAVYRLQNEKTWVELTDQETKDLFKIV